MAGPVPSADGQVDRAIGALNLLEATSWRASAHAGWFDTAELLARVCASSLGLPPLEPPPELGRGRWAAEPADRWRSIGGLDDRDRLVLAFAEQFSTDVSSITARQRGEVLRQLGNRAANVAATIYAMDFLPRTRAALRAVTRPGSAARARSCPPVGELTVWGPIEDFSRAVPGLTTLDPITTEVVRLRGARQHQCRLCTSLRSRPALLAGATEDVFSALDQDDSAAFTSLQRAALAFTDAMIWTPSLLAEPARRLVPVASEPQRIELVLDVTRNALNKVAVALGADEPHVDDGVEVYDVDADGNVLYGLALDAG